MEIGFSPRNITSVTALHYLATHEPLLTTSIVTLADIHLRLNKICNGPCSGNPEVETDHL